MAIWQDAMFGMTRGTKKGEIRSGARSPRSAKASISSEISLKPPIPVPSSQPIRVRFSLSSSSPDWSIAIFAAATPTWLKRAMRLASLKSMNLRASKFLSSATVFTGTSQTSKLVAIPRPERPSIKLSQNSARLLPFGASTPMPVTTTRCSGRTPFPTIAVMLRKGARLGLRRFCGATRIREGGREGRDHLAIDGVAGHPDRTPDGGGIGAAMGDHCDPIDAQQQPAAQLPPVDPLAQRLELGTDEQATQRRDRVPLDGITDAAEEELGGAFSRLDHHIAGKAIADDHVRLVLEDVVALDVADEIDPGCRPQKGLGRLDQLVALARLLTVAQQADPRCGDLHDALGVDRAHPSELHKVFRPRIGIRAGIQQQATPGRRGNPRADGRPFHPRDPAQPEETRGHHRPAVPGADEAGRPTVLDHLDAANDRRGLLAPDRLGRMPVHGDHLWGVLDLRPLAGPRFGQGPIDLVFLPHEDDLDPELAVGLHAAGHHLVGSKITTHGVERDLHWNPGMGAG